MDRVPAGGQESADRLPFMTIDFDYCHIRMKCPHNAPRAAMSSSPLSLRGTALEVESQIFDTLPDEMLLAVFEVVARIDPKTMLTVVHARGMSAVARTVRGPHQGVRFDLTFLPSRALPNKPSHHECGCHGRVGGDGIS
jgi:hypothetical protein